MSEVKCRKCGDVIPPKRIEILKGCTTCVKCSDTQKQSAVTVVKGEGEDTWNETVIMSPDQYKQYIEQEEKLKKLL